MAQKSFTMALMSSPHSRNIVFVPAYRESEFSPEWNKVGELQVGKDILDKCAKIFLSDGVTISHYIIGG